MFTIIAERINMTRKRISREVRRRNADFIAAEAVSQARAGATHIDVNAGGDPANEVADMEWLTGVVARATELPLSFDSTHPDALRAGLALSNRPGTLINSVNLEAERVRRILPLVQEFNTGVIALTMDDGGMPEDLAGRLRIAEELVKLFARNGISLDRVYFDPLVRPASTNPGQARDLLEAVRRIHNSHPEAHFAMGLSNISYGLPRRRLLNQAFLSMLVAAGADGAIVDATEPGMVPTLLAARAVLGLDEYCMEYITAERAGRLE